MILMKFFMHSVIKEDQRTKSDQYLVVTANHHHVVQNLENKKKIPCTNSKQAKAKSRKRPLTSN